MDEEFQIIREVLINFLAREAEPKDIRAALEALEKIRQMINEHEQG